MQETGRFVQQNIPTGRKLTLGGKRYRLDLMQIMKESRKRRKQPLTHLDINSDAFIYENVADITG